MFSDGNVINVKKISKNYESHDNPIHCLWSTLFPIARNNSKKFVALENINFSIKKGETVGIIGRNGSGKSTLLQLICGTLNPSEGEISVKGRIAALLELGSGFNPEFTGRENVYLNASILGLKRSEIEEKFSDIEKFADIGSFIEQPIKTYSSGMVVRLAFATAIHVNPDILIVDEALAVGDTAFQQKCLNKIRDMQKSGVSILLVTHSSNTLIEYCDRGIYLKKGKLILDSNCREVVKKYADDLVEEEGGASIILDGDSEKNQGNCNHNENSPIIQILKVELKDIYGNIINNFNYGDKIHISITIDIASFIAFPCFGIQISSVDGITLWSSTTQSMAIHIEPLTSGIHKFSWTLTPNFSGNRYVIALGVGYIDNGEYKRAYRLDYAGHFDVMQLPHSGSGWLAPLPLFTME